MTPKHIAILGSTGSIGTQALEVIEAHPGRFVVDVLTCDRNWQLLAQQAARHQPQMVVIGQEEHRPKLVAALEGTEIEILAGPQALLEAVQLPETTMVLTALVGFAGLAPTLAALRAGKDIALANKETLVVAGELVMQTAQNNHCRVYPVDSEHSALFQCLQGENLEAVEKLILTASGGPFRGYSKAQLGRVTKAEALKHPNWSMGAKITVDSASLMNKGLEVIEARWLFGLPVDKLDVVVHPQSIVHSLVQFVDGSLKAELGPPDMRRPIQYALGYPERLPNNFPRLDFAQASKLTFEPPARDVFRGLDFAFGSLNAGGDRPCVLNAANEVAVARFLANDIGFLDIYTCVDHALNTLPPAPADSLGHLVEIDRQTRACVAALSL